MDIRTKLLGQTVVLRPRQKTVLSLGHVNAKIKFTFTIGAGIPARPSRQYFAREPPCSRVFCTLTPVVTHYYGRDNPAHSSDTAPAWWAIPPSISRPPAPPAPPPRGTGCRWPHGQALVPGVTNIYLWCKHCNYYGTQLSCSDLHFFYTILVHISRQWVQQGYKGKVSHHIP